jgi:signal transduction histidine kinase/PAS domain-containing protein
MIGKKNSSGKASELRRRAERKAAQSLEIIDAKLPEEVKCVLHELRVHQIELEMQNEELRTSQVELEAVRARYFDLYDLAPIGYFTISEHGLILEANLTAAVMLDVHLGSLVGRPFSQFILKGDRDIYYLHSKQLLKSGEMLPFDLRMLKKGDFPFWVQLDATVAQADDYTTVIRLVISDVSERRKAEAYREMGLEVMQILDKQGDLQSAIQLVIATLKTQTGFDAVGIRLQDGDDFPYFAQKGFSKDFLLTENTLVERGADGGLCQGKDGNVSLECTCGLVISGKTNPVLPIYTRGGSFWTSDSLPLLDLPADQDPRLHPRNRCIHDGYASVALIPLRDKNMIVGLLHFNDRRKGCFTLETIKLLEEIATHIGEALMRKRLEAEKAKLEEQNRKLQKAESLGRMSGSIAHIFNNQLQVVQGYLEMVIGDLPPGESHAVKLARALQAAQKASEVSGNLLAYLGQIRNKIESLDLSGICTVSLPVLLAGMPKNVALETDLPSPGPYIGADAKQIQKILTSLVVNAWEAIGEEPGTVRLSVKIVSTADIPTAYRFPLEWQAREQSYACLEVTDSGCGIQGKDMEKLFDPFFSTKFIGRGLGLSVVLGIVKAHAAGITVENRTGAGSVFRVFFPLSKQIPFRLPGQIAKAPEIVAGGTVLLVEDEAALREMTRLALVHFGFTVLQARDGVEAVEIFRQHKDQISCLFSDLTMPRMGGWETISALRAIRHELPVILASGYDEATVMAGEHPELPDFFLNKPYDINKLGDTIGKAIARKF